MLWGNYVLSAALTGDNEIVNSLRRSVEHAIHNSEEKEKIIHNISIQINLLDSDKYGDIAQH